jgi:hypothetical protein
MKNKIYHTVRTVSETLDQLLNEHCSVQSIPKISVEQRNGQWFTSDNRRLWVFILHAIDDSSVQCNDQCNLYLYLY